MKRCFIALAVFCLFITAGMGIFNGVFLVFIDLPSFQMVNLLSFLFVGILFGFNNLKKAFSAPLKKNASKKDLLLSIDIFKFYEKILWITSSIGSFVGIILVLGNINDIESIGPNLAVALMTILYGLINIALIMPFKMLAEKQLKSQEDIL
jgi:flagellar motor component MotA